MTKTKFLQSSVQLVISHLDGRSDCSSRAPLGGDRILLNTWEVSGGLHCIRLGRCGGLVRKCTCCQPIRSVWTTINLQAVMAYHLRFGLRPFLDAVENITQPSDDQKWTIKVAHQLGVDTCLLLGAVQPHCITPAVSVLVYRAVVIVLLLAITTDFQVLAGKLVDSFHLLTELGSILHFTAAPRGFCLSDN